MKIVMWVNVCFRTTYSWKALSSPCFCCCSFIRTAACYELDLLWMLLEMFFPPASTTHVHCSPVSQSDFEIQNRLCVNSVVRSFCFVHTDSVHPMCSSPLTTQNMRTWDGTVPFAQQMSGMLGSGNSDGEKSSTEGLTLPGKDQSILQKEAVDMQP